MSDDVRFWQPLGPCGPYVVGSKRLQQAGPHEACRERELVDSENDGRQSQVMEPMVPGMKRKRECTRIVPSLPRILGTNLIFILMIGSLL